MINCPHVLRVMFDVTQERVRLGLVRGLCRRRRRTECKVKGQRGSLVDLRVMNVYRVHPLETRNRDCIPRGNSQTPRHQFSTKELPSRAGSVRNPCGSILHTRLISTKMCHAVVNQKLDKG